MLNATCNSLFRSEPPSDIPRNVVRKSQFRVPILPISQSDKAHIRVRYGAFQPPKWALLQAEMVLFAKRGNTP